MFSGPDDHLARHNHQQYILKMGVAIVPIQFCLEKQAAN